MFERLLYNQRVAQLPVWISATMVWRPRTSWQATQLKQKLLIVCLGLVLTLGLGHLVVNAISRSESNFFNHFSLGIVSAAKEHALKHQTESKTPTYLPSFVEELPHHVNDSQLLARRLSAQKFGDQYWDALRNLWGVESGWNPKALNTYSGACGLPQAMPCTKIPDMSLEGQIHWGLDYIARRYGNPANAWSWWQDHRWY